MSSRYDDAGEEGIPFGLWRNIVHRAIHGRRGQAALRELEAALLSLPRKRLIAGELTDRQDVCVVGALGLHRKVRAGLTPDAALEDLPCIETDYETAWYGREELGLTETLAWELGWVNDEKLADLAPEERYDRMLAWVREQLAAPAA